MYAGEGQLRDFLLDSGLVSRGQLELAHERAQERGETLSSALIGSGILSEEEVRRASSHALGIPYVVLQREDIDPAALPLIPEPLCRARGVVAYGTSERGVEVALLNMADLPALDFLKERMRVLVRLTSRESHRLALLLYQRQLKDHFDGTAQALLSHAASQGATAIHLEPTTDSLRIRYRLGGALHEAMVLSGERGSKLMSEIKNFKGVRLSLLKTTAGESAVIHLLRAQEGRRGFTLEALGFHGEGLQLLERALVKKSGLLSITGEGASTTLYVLLDLLVHPTRALFSIEREVEHRLPHVSQVQVSESISPSAALRSALKSDPDVVGLHDIKERSALELAAASSSRALLIVAGNAEPQGATCTIRQLLLKKLCDKCSVPHALTRSEARILEERADFARVLAALREEGTVSAQTAWKDVEFRRAEGCSACDGGYRGFVGVLEVSPGSEVTLNLTEDALFKAAQGQTSIEEVARVAAGVSA